MHHIAIGHTSTCQQPEHSESLKALIDVSKRLGSGDVVESDDTFDITADNNKLSIVVSFHHRTGGFWTEDNHAFLQRF